MNPSLHSQQHVHAASFSPFGPQPNSLVTVGSRRWFLQLGVAGAAGLSLQPWATAANSTKGKKPTSVIQIWLSGGPSQLDMWDMKPEMPAEIRGPFSPILTSVPGINICEHLPLQAAMMKDFAIVRSVDASASNHTPITFQAANPKARRVNVGRQGGGYPSMGSVAAKFHGANKPGMPPFVALADSLRSDVYGAGDLGNAYEPVDGVRAKGRFSKPAGVNVPRLRDRDHLRKSLDRLKRQADVSTSMEMQDRYAQEACNLVIGGAAERAFDLSHESPKTRDRYGRDSMGEKALLARRLVEAGVSYIVMSDAWGHWDHHGDEVRWGGIVKGLKPMLPVLDRGVTALIGDLKERGLLETTMVVVIGEFGRTPVMTKTAGRGHWTPVMSMLMAGGGIKGGQVIGATDRRGGEIKNRPVRPGDLAATVFTHLGIDPGDHWINPQGRPTPLVDGDAAPIRELF
ncbi:MAG: DUF1501 domain-containing protein [Planctomycetaceae bacterium]